MAKAVTDIASYTQVAKRVIYAANPIYIRFQCSINWQIKLCMKVITEMLQTKNIKFTTVPLKCHNDIILMIAMF